MAWGILAEMAEAENCLAKALISAFHDELVALWSEALNFASFLRVTCLRYLRRSLIATEKKAQLLELAVSEEFALPAQAALKRLGLKATDPLAN